MRIIAEKRNKKIFLRFQVRTPFQYLSSIPSIHPRLYLVRKYLEGMKDSPQLLDLLSATSSDDIEQTKATATRSALYPDVRLFRRFTMNFTDLSLVSPHRNPSCWRQGGTFAPRLFQCQPIQLFGGQFRCYLHQVLRSSVNKLYREVFQSQLLPNLFFSLVVRT